MVKEEVIVCTFLPTYCIQNETRRPLFVHGMSRRPSKEDNSDWEALQLKPCYIVAPTRRPNKQTIPIPVFSTNGQKFDPNMPHPKCLALSCGGPWWFVQLIKFELVFDYTKGGIPAERLGLSLPEVSLASLKYPRYMMNLAV